MFNYMEELQNRFNPNFVADLGTTDDVERERGQGVTAGPDADPTAEWGTLAGLFGAVVAPLALVPATLLAVVGWRQAQTS